MRDNSKREGVVIPKTESYQDLKKIPTTFWCPTTGVKLNAFPEALAPIPETEQNIYNYVPQSGEVKMEGTAVMAPTGMATEQITGFADQDAGWKAEVGADYDTTMDLASNNDSTLGEFLSRPIRAQTYTWAVGQPLYQDFNPWSAFITNPRVAEKLANYELLRCKMNMKIVISGTGFHYGRAIVSYNPLTGYDDITTTRNFLDIDIVGASQRPHFYLNPTNNTGGEMTMPFFFLQNYMSLSKQDYNDMGTVNIKGFDNLKHANGGDDPVTITVYLWATDVVLTMPTSITTAAAFTPQAGSKNKGGKKTATNSNGGRAVGNKMNSGDEYGQGIISKPASAIANAAGMLATIPAIAPYARATQMVSEKVGQIAMLFGYSRPPVVTDILLQKPSPTGNLANVDAADAVNRLTLDSKQELTIDSRTVGLDGVDQMSLKSIQSRESYLGNFEWKTTDAVDSILWNSYVTPNLYRSGGAVAGAEMHPTPMSMLAQYFTNWQGSIKFRFQIVKSNFHKGRLLLRWDPRSHGAAISYNTVYSRVVDIAEEDDFEVTIGWGQNRPFLSSQQMNENNTYFGTTRLTTDSNNLFNGILEVDVLNSLVSPSVDSDIRINVFVSACDDMKWGAPNPDRLRNLHLFPIPQGEAAETPNLIEEYSPQSGEVMAAGSAADISGTTNDDTDRPVDVSNIQDMSSTLGETDHQMEVFFGEAPTSLRDLLRRYYATRTWIPPAVANNNLQVNTLRLKAYPYHTGYDTDGLDQTASAAPYTYGQTHPLTWFAPCYAGWRGGLRKKLLFDGSSGTNPTVTRYGFLSGKGFQTSSLPIDGQTTSEDIQIFLSEQNNRFTIGGSAATNLGVNNTIEVEVPFYNGVRLQSPRQPNASFNCGAHSVQVQSLSADLDGTVTADRVINTGFQDWTATGEDFTLFFWSGTPIVYRYASPS